VKLELKPIGVVHSPYKSKEDVLHRVSSTVCEIGVSKEFEEGLKDVEGFSHLIILWIFHKSKGYSLHVKPLWYKGLRGVFATRHPNRPNPIGFTVVELLERKGNILKVRGVDMLDGTPIVDIKPYTSHDRKGNIRAGWLEEAHCKLRH